ncbi:Putative iron-sulfur cluster assembly scaffold protein for SUF system, SufE2 [Bartonella ancashensis]|uniref:Putative iron-sulfur cluster assembly scaffold protein for SUF system, SufE2 n=1 Tax=Bartonella ancashensis TaxID=1318743 RepID=A0A0M4M6K8_9HYPH|nr:Putative iron-sulfur cluster assembly scaffold protein for SUF system, SufE2 [Bartonella ancashensis]
MIYNIYSREILKHAAHISKVGRLDNPDVTSKKRARLCGSTVLVDLKIEDKIVIDFSHEIRACALGQAASSILARHIVGKKIQDLKELQNVIQHMLTKNGPPPLTPFEEFSCLQPLKNYKERHASIMIIFDAIIDCIKQFEEKTDGLLSPTRKESKKSELCRALEKNSRTATWHSTDTSLSNNTF